MPDAFPDAQPTVQSTKGKKEVKCWGNHANRRNDSCISHGTYIMTFITVISIWGVAAAGTGKSRNVHEVLKPKNATEAVSHKTKALKLETKAYFG